MNRGTAVKHFFFNQTLIRRAAADIKKRHCLCSFFSEPDHTSRTKRHTEDRRTRTLGWMHESESLPPPPPPHPCYPCTATLLIMSPEGCLSRITKFWFLGGFFSPSSSSNLAQSKLNKNYSYHISGHVGSRNEKACLRFKQPGGMLILEGGGLRVLGWTRTGSRGNEFPPT